MVAGQEAVKAVKAMTAKLSHGLSGPAGDAAMIGPREDF
jgi:hypothetical protein